MNGALSLSPDGATDNIVLSTDGSAEFAGRITGESDAVIGNLTAGNYSYVSSTSLTHNSQAGATTDSTRLAVKQDNVENFRVQTDGGVGIGGTLPNDPNIALNAAGSAEFAAGLEASGITQMLM